MTINKSCATWSQRTIANYHYPAAFVFNFKTTFTYLGLFSFNVSLPLLI